MKKSNNFKETAYLLSFFNLKLKCFF